MKTDNITKRDKDYSQWYLDVIEAADMAEHSPVKGCMVIKPTGYEIWENIQKILDKKFKQTGVKNAYFPLFIPEDFLTKEAEHVEGFAPEVAKVTQAGGQKLSKPLVVRPTSETIMYDVFSKWVKSYRDLPILINQWANIVRWELRTRLFLRTTEFLWQEGHTVHASEKEALERTKQMLDVYADFAKEYLAIPVVKGVKSNNEKFAGAVDTYTAEAMMQDGKALQMGTSHNLGQNFSKAFDIKYLDKNNKEQYAWQTSWGVSTRLIGALIMVHSDDEGLVLPPKLAATKVVILSIFNNDEAKRKVSQFIKDKVGKNLGLDELEYQIDTSDKRIGQKHFEWEKKGVPIRIEVGPKDVENDNVVLVRRDNKEKTIVKITQLKQSIGKMLDDIQNNLFDKAKARMEENTVEVDNYDDFKRAIKENKFVYAYWDGTSETERKIKEQTKATIRCIPFEKTTKKGKSLLSDKETEIMALFAKNY